MRFMPRILTLTIFLGTLIPLYFFLRKGHLGATLCAAALAGGIGVMVVYDVWRTWLELRKPKTPKT